MKVVSKASEYFHSLDTLRFVAFFCVFISHVFVFSGISSGNSVIEILTPYLFTQGNLGVSLFFVLSGFLITWLLFKEKEKNEGLAIRKFYMRRILRIWPVYLLVLFVGMMVIPFLLVNINDSVFIGSGLLEYTPSGLWKYVFFAMNSYMVDIGRIPFYIAILWSISIEEQFYFVWPWIVKMFNKSKLPILFIFLIISSTYFRFNNIHDMEYIRYATMSVLSDLVMGAFGAYLVLYLPRLKEWFIEQRKYIGYILLISVPVVFYVFKIIELHSVSTDTIFPDLVFTLSSTAISIYFLYIVLFVTYNKHAYLKVPLKRTCEFLGQRSYGLYCYHAFGLLLTNILIRAEVLPVSNTTLSLLIYMIVSFGITLVITVTSYSYVEKPILKLKERFV
ncbi:MAG: acyltransferase [Candidatus Taylorbacteria bacterium]|nr:acyltransferase [Candidatus Taylorbacteria bacterium]